MFEDKEVDLWKVLVVILAFGLGLVWLCVCTLESISVEAATLKPDYPVGGYSYYMTRYVERGGNLEDCLPDAYKIDESEREVLYRIVEAEVTGEGGTDYYDAKRNVASVIVHRWETGWADSIEEVVFQKCGRTYQFSPIKDGRYWSVTVTEQTKEAVDWVLHNGLTMRAQYFCTRTCESYKSGFHSTLKVAGTDCEHTFFY